MRRCVNKLVTVLSLLVVGSVACSSEGDPGSCYRDRDNACTEYGRAQGAAGRRMCGSFKWIPGEKSCPHDDRLGTCIKKDGADHIYGGGPNNFTLSVAKNTCEFAGGVFTTTLDANARPGARDAAAR